MDIVRHKKAINEISFGDNLTLTIRTEFARVCSISGKINWSLKTISLFNTQWHFHNENIWELRLVNGQRLNIWLIALRLKKIAQHFCYITFLCPEVYNEQTNKQLRQMELYIQFWIMFVNS